MTSLFSEPAFQLAALVVLAVGCGWLADRLRIPSILPLLVVGLSIGPGLGWINPDAVFGGIINSVVGLAVGVILFEGGLSLRFGEIAAGTHRVIWGLVTVGVVVTWAIGTASALFFIDMEPRAALVLGSILVVSGPTVIGPVLRAVRPSRRVGSILKWESILIDPIGAMLAVITFDAVVADSIRPGFIETAGEISRFTLTGVGFGAVVAIGAASALQRHWVPQHLISLFGLASALVAFTVADLVAPESGLLSTIVVGLILANNRKVRTESLLEFSEILRVLLIGVLFIVLSAQLTRDQLGAIGWGAGALVAALVLVARPLAVWLAAIGSGLAGREKALLAGVAPRGIVAASIASVFGLGLEEAGIEGAELVTPVAFAVIIASVIVYGIGAGPLARTLGLAPRSNEGVLILGAGQVERAIAEALSEAGVYVVLATVNGVDEQIARMAGLKTFYGNVLSADVDLRLEMSGIGRLLALTPNEDVNTLAALRFHDLFGGAYVYQLPPTPPPPGVEQTTTELGGRGLFGHEWTYPHLRTSISAHGVRRTKLSESFNRAALLEMHGSDIVALAVVREGKLIVGATDTTVPLLDRLQNGDEVLWTCAVDVEDQTA